jgi:alanine racemase
MTQWIELSRSAWRNNISLLRSLQDSWQLWPCLKANAYGHGMLEAAQAFDDLVDGYCVVSTTEALLLREVTQKPIMVLNIVEEDEVLECASSNIILPLASNELKELYANVDRDVSVHLELDTGMARTGFRWETVEQMAQYVSQLPENIVIEGMFSHYAAAGEDHNYTRKQFDDFAPFVEKICSLFPEKKLVIHIDKSASLLMKQYHFSSQHLNASRPGFAVYGFDPEWGLVERLQPVLTWKTKILSVRTLHKGEAVGYGLTFTAQRDTQIATIPIGYADGYDRSLSNRSEVLVRGSRCPVRGRICMNLTMIEVPPEVRVDDEVVLLGGQGEEYISAPELARSAETSPYEIVTRLHPAIARQLTE